ncbi:hypothetical protein B14911_03354 [Bacillus sp. NRRL B-14911]|nr:hypothetical protein B14911_03354 [Bacillus sp. NRRL B-14911]
MTNTFIIYKPPKKALPNGRASSYLSKKMFEHLVSSYQFDKYREVTGTLIYGEKKQAKIKISLLI